MLRIIFFILLGISSLSFAETSVWTVSKGARLVYLGGTFHLLAKGDFPLPSEFEKAYRSSSVVVFETDLDAMEGPEFKRQLTQRMMYHDGRTLKSELSPEVYGKLAEYSASRGMNFALFKPFKPGFVVLTLSVMELQRLGLTQSGVDRYYYRKAQSDQKKIGQFETLQEQLSLIADMGMGQEDEMVLSTLKEMEGLEFMMSELKTAWREGDQDKIEEVALSKMKDDFPSVYKSIVVDRNDAWLARIEKLLGTTETEFVLVGVVHMVGRDGVLQKLRLRGYQVEKL